MHDVDELIKAAESMNHPWYTAELVDRYLAGKWQDHGEIQESLLLELRVFDASREVKLFREDLGSAFRFRILDDEEKSSEHSFDELQLLDIDREKSAGDTVITTGGGKYELPHEVWSVKNPAVRIRHYYRFYDQTGEAYIYDWRCVGFEHWKEVDE